MSLVCERVCVLYSREEWRDRKRSICITPNEQGCQSLKCSTAPNNLAAECSILIGGLVLLPGEFMRLHPHCSEGFYCCPAGQYGALVDLMRAVRLSPHTEQKPTCSFCLKPGLTHSLCSFCPAQLTVLQPLLYVSVCSVSLKRYNHNGTSPVLLDMEQSDSSCAPFKSPVALKLLFCVGVASCHLCHYTCDPH